MPDLVSRIQMPADRSVGALRFGPLAANIDDTALDRNSDAVAYAVWELSQ